MNPALLLTDLLAIGLLVLLFYLPRGGRRELVGNLLVTNVGVMAVATAMATGTIGAGLGLGLFGVLSIIRLRSEELSHREIAYYFAALSLGLLGGLGSLPIAWGAGLMVLVLAAIAVGDHPRIVGHSRCLELVIDRAITEPDALSAYVRTRLGAHIDELTVRRIDLVNDTTAVRVRYSPETPRSAHTMTACAAPAPGDRVDR